MITYEVTVERAEKYWRVSVPKVDRVTQARSLREVEVMARDLIEAMTDEPADPRPSRRSPASWT